MDQDWATQPAQARISVVEGLLQQLLVRLNAKGALSNADLDEIASGAERNIRDGEEPDLQQQLAALTQMQWGFLPST